jgi:hypothetical protein
LAYRCLGPVRAAAAPDRYSVPVAVIVLTPKISRFALMRPDRGRDRQVVS